VYAATKAGLIGLTRSLAVELAPKHIRVNIVLPGFTRIDPLHNFRIKVPQELWDDFSRRYRVGISAGFERFQPLPRCIEAEDIARAAAFLCSEEARCITGVELLVDGAANLRNAVTAETVSKAFDWSREMEEWLAGEIAAREKAAI
jgi:NAD(P)-dependent dehydrogenase (short-subunit alcohol dehydrogenase family)